MTNDAKLGMLVGVVGVVLAAVFLAQPPAPPAEAAPPVAAQPQPAALPSAPAATATAAKPPAFPSTPVARARKDAPAQPVGRYAVAADEEP